MIEVKDELWKEDVKEEGPPFFNKWREAYIFILGVHVIVIIIFYIIMQSYHIAI